jgi:hypothetical protein
MANQGESEAGYDQLAALLSLIDVDPDEIRAAEMAEAQSILDTMVGHKIVAVTIDEKRIVVETDDGSRYNFYGLMGGGGPAPEPTGALSAR